MATPARAVAWLQGNENPPDPPISSTSRSPVMFLPLRLDLNVSPGAPKCHPDCTQACIHYFLFHAGGQTAPFGTGGYPPAMPGWPVRVFISRAGSAQLIELGVGIEAPPEPTTPEVNL